MVWCERWNSVGHIGSEGKGVRLDRSGVKADEKFELKRRQRKDSNVTSE